MKVDTQFLVQKWDDEVGAHVDATLEVDRTDEDEVMVNIQVHGDEEGVSAYLDRDHALEMGHALIEQALRAWS